jgi:leucyl aminopeptidase (aminopeptidase T)
MMSPIPLWTEVAWACVEDKTEGRIVVDGIQLGIGMPGTLPRPIEWIVKDGRAVEINGGVEAEALKKTIAGVKNVEIIGEIGVGISDKPPFGGPSEKGKLGTAHFALGDNCHAYPGGQNDCRLHLDGSVRNCTFRVDDKVVVENGEWKL